MITTIHTENSTYEFDDTTEESKKFRRVSCSRGKAMNFDNVWTPYFSRTMYGSCLMITLIETDKYGEYKYVLTSRVVER